MSGLVKGLKAIDGNAEQVIICPFLFSPDNVVALSVSDWAPINSDFFQSLFFDTIRRHVVFCLFN